MRADDLEASIRAPQHVLDDLLGGQVSLARAPGPEVLVEQPRAAIEARAFRRVARPPLAVEHVPLAVVQAPEQRPKCFVVTLRQLATVTRRRAETAIDAGAELAPGHAPDPLR